MWEGGGTLLGGGTEQKVKRIHGLGQQCGGEGYEGTKWQRKKYTIKIKFLKKITFWL